MTFPMIAIAELLAPTPLSGMAASGVAVLSCGVAWALMERANVSPRLAVILAFIEASLFLADSPRWLLGPKAKVQAWLDAFNRADRAKIETYTKTIDHNQSVDGMLRFRNGTGGLDLVSIESSEPLHIRFRVKEKNSATTALGSLIVKDG
ncbi:MAG TPA: hypothetical protein VGM27_09090 [Acidobacteriaceae bacterium]